MVVEYMTPEEYEVAQIQVKLTRDYGGYAKGTIAVIECKIGSRYIGALMPDGRKIQLSTDAIKYLKPKKSNRR